MEAVPQTGRLVNRLISQILCGDELKLPSDAREFKDLRKIVKGSPQIVPELAKRLFVHLEKWDAVTRHASLLLTDYFFHRSHQFRLETIEKLPEFLELVCESNPLRMPLPGPAAGAKELKIAAIKIIKAWHEKFHTGYASLDFVCQFLQNSKSVDYERATAEVDAERRAREKQEQKVAEQNEKKTKKIMKKFASAKEDIERSITEVDSGLRILVPSFEDSSLEGEDQPSTSDMDRLNGITDGVMVVLKTIQPEVLVSEDNEAVVEAVRDGHRALDGYLKFLIHSLSALQKFGAGQQQISQLVEIKSRLTGLVQKVEELKLTRKKTKKMEGTDSEDSDMEDVPEKELEDFVLPYEVPKYIMEKIRKDEEADQPCCSKTVEKTEIRPVKPKIPVLPYGLDLKYWGEERGSVEAPKNNFDGHRFWRPPDETEATKIDSSVYETRMFPFIGEELRPKRQCRARLVSGELCPRRDKAKCPVHGPIVNRDEEGFPVSEILTMAPVVDVQRVEMEEEEFIRDIELATGKDLSGIKKKKKNRYAPTQAKVVRDRLERKLLDKRTLKRIGDTLDAIQRAKIEKKHGSQFVHALHK